MSAVVLLIVSVSFFCCGFTWGWAMAQRSARKEVQMLEEHIDRLVKRWEAER